MSSNIQVDASNKNAAVRFDTPPIEFCARNCLKISAESTEDCNVIIAHAVTFPKVLKRCISGQAKNEDITVKHHKINADIAIGQLSVVWRQWHLDTFAISVCIYILPRLPSFVECPA